MTRRAFDPDQPVERPTPALAGWLAGARIWDLAMLRRQAQAQAFDREPLVTAEALLEASESDLALLDELGARGGDLRVDFTSLGPVGDPRADRLAALVEALKRRGLRVHGLFTLGLDHDDLGCFERLVDWVEARGLGRVELRIWTPEPGSAQVRELARADRIRHHDLPRWDGAHVVVNPAQMSAEALYRGWVWARRQLSSPASLWRRRPRVRAELPTYLLAILRDAIAPLGARVSLQSP